MPYKSIVITGENGTGKSSIANEIRELSADEPYSVYPSSTALIRYGIKIAERDKKALADLSLLEERIIRHGKEQIKNHGYLFANKREFSLEQCFRFGREVYSRLNQEGVADMHIRIAKSWFPWSNIVYEGIRYYGTARRFKEKGAFVIFLEADHEILVARLVDIAGMFKDHDEARKFFIKSRKEYGFKHIKESLSDLVLNTSSLNPREAALAAKQIYNHQNESL